MQCRRIPATSAKTVEPLLGGISATAGYMIQRVMIGGCWQMSGDGQPAKVRGITGPAIGDDELKAGLC